MGLPDDSDDDAIMGHVQKRISMMMIDGEEGGITDSYGGGGSGDGGLSYGGTGGPDLGQLESERSGAAPSDYWGDRNADALKNAQSDAASRAGTTSDISVPSSSHSGSGMSSGVGEAPKSDPSSSSSNWSSYLPPGIGAIVNKIHSMAATPDEKWRALMLALKEEQHMAVEKKDEKGNAPDPVIALARAEQKRVLLADRVEQLTKEKADALAKLEGEGEGRARARRPLRWGGTSSRRAP